MKLILITCVWIFALIGKAVAGPAGEAFSPKEYKNMSFLVFVPCSGNASFCAPTVLAKGTITPDSAKELEAFVKRRRKLPYSNPERLASYVRVCFDSPGGSLGGGIMLGETVRKMKLDTCLAPAYKENDNPARDAFQDEDVICASSCVLALGGGMNRVVEEGSRLGVHQFYSTSGQIGDEETQITVVRIAEYLEHMGVSRRLLDVASLVPSGQIYWLSKQQIQTVSLDNTVRPLIPWQLKANRDGKVVAWVSQPISKSSDANVTQLMLIRDKIGLVLLIRGEFHDRFAVNLNEGLSALNTSNGQPNIWLQADNRTVVSQTVKWRAQADGQSVVALVSLTSNEALALANAKVLHFMTSCPHSMSEYALDTDISTKGAPGIFRAVLRP